MTEGVDEDTDDPEVSGPTPARNLPLENALTGRGIQVEELRVSPTGGAHLGYITDADTYDIPAVIKVFTTAVDAIDGPIIATVIDPETDRTRSEYAIKAGWLRQYKGDQIQSSELIQRILALEETDIDQLYEAAFEGTGAAFLNRLERLLNTLGFEVSDSEVPASDTVRLHVRVTPAALDTEAVTERGPVAACLPGLLYFFGRERVQFEQTYRVVVEDVTGEPVDTIELPAEKTIAYGEALYDPDQDEIDLFWPALRAALDSATTTSPDVIDTYYEQVQSTAGSPLEGMIG